MRVAGLSSHVSDAGHAAFVDLDKAPGCRDPGEAPKDFREAVKSALIAFDAPFAWVFKTGGGYHLVVPFAFELKEALSFHRRFNDWGADDMHRRVAISSGRFILRVTPKFDEGPKFVATIRGNTSGRSLLMPIAKFYWQRFPIKQDLDLMTACSSLDGNGEVTVEAYDVEAVHAA